MKTYKKKHSTAGFTLVELIVVIVIILILAAVLVPQLLKYVDRANQAKCAQQRRELANEFQIIGTEVAGLGECTSVAAVEGLLGGNAISYMIDKGFAQADATLCPVHDETYTLDVSYSNNRQNVTFVCPCVESLNGYTSIFAPYYDKLGNNKSDAGAMIKYLEDHDGFPKVSSSITSGTSFANKDDLYWRPYRLNDGTIILYAGEGNSKNGDENVHSQWKASLLYINGTLYQSTLTNTNGKPDGTGISAFHNYSLSDVTSKIENSEITFSPAN